MKKLLIFLILSICILGGEKIININIIKLKVNSISRLSNSEKNQIIKLSEQYNIDMQKLILQEEQIEKTKKIEYNSKNPSWTKLKSLEEQEDKIKKLIETKEKNHEIMLEKYFLDDDYDDDYKYKK